MDRQLNTARLRLRAPRPGDEAAAFARWAADAEVLRYLGWRPHPDLAATRRQLAWDEARWLKRSACTWMLVPHGDPQPAGQVQLVARSTDGPVRHWRLGYLLARSHQGRGLMREAVAAVLDHALAQPEVWRVDALCDVDNQASQRLLQALHFCREGRLARHSVHPQLGADPRDVWLFARVREGAALPALGEGVACDWCAARGLCRRDHWTAEEAES